MKSNDMTESHWLMLGNMIHEPLSDNSLLFEGKKFRRIFDDLCLLYYLKQVDNNGIYSYVTNKDGITAFNEYRDREKDDGMNEPKLTVEQAEALERINNELAYSFRRNNKEIISLSEDGYVEWLGANWVLTKDGHNALRLFIFKMKMAAHKPGTILDKYGDEIVASNLDSVRMSEFMTGSDGNVVRFGGCMQPGQLTFNEYQKRAAETANYPKDKGLEYTALGLVGEAGEIANKAKKVLRGDYDVEHLKTLIGPEIGDVLWYCAMLAKELGLDFEEIAQANLDKLADRKARGVIKGDGDTR